MSFGQVNADVIGTSVAGSNIGAGNASIMKNRIINGAMVISQYNGTSSTTLTGSTYVIDRWRLIVSASSKLSVQQNAGSVTPPVGFPNYLGLTSLAATTVAAGDEYVLYQKIEGFNTADLAWGTANAKTITLSFQVYSSLTGTFGGAINNSDQSRSYPFSYSIPTANTWTTITVTVAGDTTGTWVGATNGVGMVVRFGLGVGSTYSGTAGSWSGNSYDTATGAVQVVATNGATFYITGVQLEVGSFATGFEYVNYQTSLANCQRYYWKVSGSNASQYIFSGYWANSSTVVIVAKTAVTMRTAPTVSASNVIAVNPTGADGLYSSIASQQATIEGSRLSLTVTGTSGVINGYPSALGFSTTSPSYMDFSAEL
jgi:hypothetical protein